jgi:hypothetical protein
MLIILFFAVGLLLRRAHHRHAPIGKVLVVAFVVFVFRSVVIAVVADETDVNAYE